jgi:putative membrane protein
LQAAHRHLPIGADGSVDLAGGDIHAGSIADRGRPVWRLSDLIISSRNGRTHHRAADMARASVTPQKAASGGRHMIWIANALVALVAALHVYFLILEMFLWTRPLGLKTFRNSPEKAADSAVLAANQGLYNGFLAAGLVWGLIQGVPGFAFQIKVFFLLCVIVAGVYGAATVSRRILMVQAAPAAVALVLLWLA